MTITDPTSPQSYLPLTPDWNHWKPAKSARLWHLAALACNLDPYQFCFFDTPELDRQYNRLPRPLLEMIELAKSGISAGGILKAISISTKSLEESEVSTSIFGSWAKSIRYSVPTEFPWQDEPTLPLSREWPWGTYETEALRKLAGAAEKFWRRYDPSDPTTAPTKKVVVASLENEGVATRTAEIMATILRADDLAPGPRK